MLEPCAHGEECQVHAGGGGQEGGARDEHARTAHHDAETQSPNIGSELT